MFVPPSMVLRTAVLAAACVSPAATAGTLDDVREQAATLRADHSLSLRSFAAEADELDLPEFAADLRRLVDPPVTRGLTYTPPPRAVRQPIPSTLPPSERALRTRVRRAGETYAAAVFKLARIAGGRGAGEPGAASVAFGLTREVLAADPDYGPARRVIGQVRDGDLWRTPWEREQARRRFVDHPDYGWVPQTHVEKLDAGERPLAGRWVSADREKLVREDIRNGWVCETEHYCVTTNHSLERGVATARQLERFQTMFRAIFPGFGLTDRELRKRFSGSGAIPSDGPPGDKYEVTLFRGKGEYVLTLQRFIPQIAITNGLYLTDHRRAYFYADGPGYSPRTVFHEATHQLFYESSARRRLIAEDAHFWVMEGIGCYMESFNDDGLTMTVGDPRYERRQNRFMNAQVRFVRDRFHVPLAELDERGRPRFQAQPAGEMRKIYSQISGVIHFLMHAESGALRPAFTAHLEALYQPLVRPGSVAGLDRFTGRPWDLLDRQYTAYIDTLDTGVRDQITPANGDGIDSP